MSNTNIATTTPSSFDVTALFKMADTAQKHKGNQSRFQEAVDHFYKILVDASLKKSKKAARNGNTSCVLYKLDLEGYSWSAMQEELKAIKNGAKLQDQRFAPHHYEVRIQNGRTRQVCLKDLWFKHGLRQKFESFLLKRDDDGNVMKGEDGKPLKASTVFMKHTKQKKTVNGVEVPIKGVWFFILDWTRPGQKRQQRKPQSSEYTPKSPEYTPESVTNETKAEQAYDPAASDVSWENLVAKTNAMKTGNWGDDDENDMFEPQVTGPPVTPESEEN